MLGKFSKFFSILEKSREKIYMNIQDVNNMIKKIDDNICYLIDAQYVLIIRILYLTRKKTPNILVFM